MKNNPTIRFAFFGTDPLARAVLDAFEHAGFTPALVVAAPDSLGRNKQPVFPSEKGWALEQGIALAQPQAITPEFIAELSQSSWDVFIVASYGKILPKTLLDIPRRGTINLHPSLLPRLRGPSPIRSAILNDEREVGVSVMLLDDKMDHGPIIAQRVVATPEWPMRGRALDTLLAREGAQLFAETLPAWLEGTIEPKEQDHSQATYCKMFTKEEGEIDLHADAQANLRKICAFDGWPGTYAFFERHGEKIRVAIIDAHIENNALVIDTVKPAGKNEMPYADFLRSGAVACR